MAANAVLIVGESGSGKSTSMENLPPESTFVINVSSKDLPFRGWKRKYTDFTKETPGGNLLNTDNADTIVSTLKYINGKRPEIKYVIIDDSQYVAANEYMRRVNDKGFDKFVQIALNIFKIPTALKAAEFRGDLTVFFMSHADKEVDSEGVEMHRAKTLGKMINNTICYDGLFTIVLFTYKKELKDGTEYGFITNGDPASTAKSPRGMFTTKTIPNDLLMVAQAIKEYEEG